mmetsp:Transcript_31491/g.62217  ORF Transcript_31491/g.62217 Transcript_31491/m.62217 type:complete len:283 (-) Transcript_31491:309-1157(-)
MRTSTDCPGVTGTVHLRSPMGTSRAQVSFTDSVPLPMRAQLITSIPSKSADTEGNMHIFLRSHQLILQNPPPDPVLPRVSSSVPQVTRVSSAGDSAAPQRPFRFSSLSLRSLDQGLMSEEVHSVGHLRVSAEHSGEVKKSTWLRTISRPLAPGIWERRNSSDPLNCLTGCSHTNAIEVAQLWSNNAFIPLVAFRYTQSAWHAGSPALSGELQSAGVPPRLSGPAYHCDVFPQASNSNPVPSVYTNSPSFARSFSPIQQAVEPPARHERMRALLSPAPMMLAR